MGKGSASPPASQWVFETVPPMGGATGEAFTNTLASSGMDPASVLAREAIQNSVDAHAPGVQKVRIDFVAKAITGKDKAQFVTASRIGSIAERADRLGLKEPNCIAELEESGVPLNLLFIDDFNTTGLEGNPTDSDSKFSRFLLSLGDGGKEHSEHGTGGSYGFGKSVYSSNSGILTIFAYSRTVDSHGKPMSLLFGCGYFRKHKHGEQGFTGRGWFGRDESENHPHAHQRVAPLLGLAADAMANKLGFTPRKEGELGTSVLIVDSLVEPDDILRGIEDWWWPRLITNTLDVHVFTSDGKSKLPRPRKRNDLRPFLEAFEAATGKSPANGKTSFQKTFNKSSGQRLGDVGFVVLERDKNDNFPVPDERLDSVALIRSPLMVVAYHRQWTIGSPVLAGAYVADDDIDDILRAAEPPAHDRWDREARRLKDKSGNNKEIVGIVLGRIRSSLKSTQSNASPPPPPRPKRLSLLERTLASFLTPSKKGPPPKPEPTTAPIHLTYEKEPHIEAVGASLRLKAVFYVRLKADETADSIQARVRITCPIVEDGAIGDPLPLSFSSDISLADDPDRAGWKMFNLDQSQVARFECETDPYDPLWTVRFVPEIEAVGGAQ